MWFMDGPMHYWDRKLKCLAIFKYWNVVYFPIQKRNILNLIHEIYRYSNIFRA